MPKPKSVPTSITPKTPGKASQIPIPLGAKPRNKLPLLSKSEKSKKSLLNEPETHDFSTVDPPKQKHNSPKTLMPKERKPDKEASAALTSSQDANVRDVGKNSVKAKARAKRSKEETVLQVDPPLELEEEEKERPRRDLIIKPKEGVAQSKKRKAKEPEENESNNEIGGELSFQSTPSKKDDQRKGGREEDKKTKKAEIGGFQQSSIDGLVKTRKKGQAQKKDEPTSQMTVSENDSNTRPKSKLSKLKSVESKERNNLSKNTNDDPKSKAIVSGSKAVELKEKTIISIAKASGTKTKILAPNLKDEDLPITELPSFKSRKQKPIGDPSPVVEQSLAFKTADAPELKAVPLGSRNVPQKSTITDSKTKVKSKLSSADSWTDLSKADKRHWKQDCNGKEKSSVESKAKTLEPNAKSSDQEHPKRTKQPKSNDRKRDLVPILSNKQGQESATIEIRRSNDETGNMNKVETPQKVSVKQSKQKNRELIKHETGQEPIQTGTEEVRSKVSTSKELPMAQKTKKLTKTKSHKSQDEPKKPSLSKKDTVAPKLQETIDQKDDQSDSKTYLMAKIDDYKSRSKAKKMRFIQELLDSLNDEGSDEGTGDAALEADGSDTEDKAKDFSEGETGNISEEDVMAEEEKELIIVKKETKTDDEDSKTDSSDSEVDRIKSSSSETDEESETDADEEDGTSADNTDTEDENQESSTEKDRESDDKPDSGDFESSQDEGTDVESEPDVGNNGSSEIEVDNEEEQNTQDDSTQDESTNSGEIMEKSHITQEKKLEQVLDDLKMSEHEFDESSSEYEESGSELEERDDNEIKLAESETDEVELEPEKNELDQSEPKNAGLEHEAIRQENHEPKVGVVLELEKSGSEPDEIELEDEGSELAEAERDEFEESDYETEKEEEPEEQGNRSKEGDYAPSGDQLQSRVDDTGAAKNYFENKTIDEEHLGQYDPSDDDEKNDEDSWSDSQEDFIASVNEGERDPNTPSLSNSQMDSNNESIQESVHENAPKIEEEFIDESREDQQEYEDEELGSTTTSDEYESLDFATIDEYDKHGHQSMPDEVDFIGETELEGIPEALEPSNEPTNRSGAHLNSLTTALDSDAENMKSSDQHPERATQGIHEVNPIDQVHLPEEKRSQGLELKDDLALKEKAHNDHIATTVQKQTDFRKGKSKRTSNKEINNFPRTQDEINTKVEVVVPIIHRKLDPKPEAQSLEKRKETPKPKYIQNMREEHFEEVNRSQNDSIAFVADQDPSITRPTMADDAEELALFEALEIEIQQEVENGSILIKEEPEIKDAKESSFVIESDGGPLAYSFEGQKPHKNEDTPKETPENISAEVPTKRNLKKKQVNQTKGKDLIRVKSTAPTKRPSISPAASKKIGKPIQTPVLRKPPPYSPQCGDISPPLIGPSFPELDPSAPNQSSMMMKSSTTIISSEMEIITTNQEASEVKSSSPQVGADMSNGTPLTVLQPSDVPPSSVVVSSPATSQCLSEQNHEIIGPHADLRQSTGFVSTPPEPQAIVVKVPPTASSSVASILPGVTMPQFEVLSSSVAPLSVFEPTAASPPGKVTPLIVAQVPVATTPLVKADAAPTPLVSPTPVIVVPTPFATPPPSVALSTSVAEVPIATLPLVENIINVAPSQTIASPPVVLGDFPPLLDLAIKPSASPPPTFVPPSPQARVSVPATVDLLVTTPSPPFITVPSSIEEPMYRVPSAPFDSSTSLTDPTSPINIASQEAEDSLAGKYLNLNSEQDEATKNRDKEEEAKSDTILQSQHVVTSQASLGSSTEQMSVSKPTDDTCHDFVDVNNDVDQGFKSNENAFQSSNNESPDLLAEKCEIVQDYQKKSGKTFHLTLQGQDVDPEVKVNDVSNNTQNETDSPALDVTEDNFLTKQPLQDDVIASSTNSETSVTEEHLEKIEPSASNLTNPSIEESTAIKEQDSRSNEKSTKESEKSSNEDALQKILSLIEKMSQTSGSDSVATTEATKIVEPPQDKYKSCPDLSKEQSFEESKAGSLSKSSETSFSLVTISPDNQRDVPINSEENRRLGQEVEFALQSILEMKTAMTKMMEMLAERQDKEVVPSDIQDPSDPSDATPESEYGPDEQPCLVEEIEFIPKTDIESDIARIKNKIQTDFDSGVSEDPLLPVTEQRRVFELEAMRALFDEKYPPKKIAAGVFKRKVSLEGPVPLTLTPLQPEEKRSSLVEVQDCSNKPNDEIDEGEKPTGFLEKCQDGPDTQEIISDQGKKLSQPEGEVSFHDDVLETDMNEITTDDNNVEDELSVKRENDSIDEKDTRDKRIAKDDDINSNQGPRQDEEEDKTVSSHSLEDRHLEEKPSRDKTQNVCDPIPMEDAYVEEQDKPSGEGQIHLQNQFQDYNINCSLCKSKPHSTDNGKSTDGLLEAHDQAVESRAFILDDQSDLDSYKTSSCLIDLERKSLNISAHKDETKLANLEHNDHQCQNMETQVNTSHVDDVESSIVAHNTTELTCLTSPKSDIEDMAMTIKKTESPPEGCRAIKTQVRSFENSLDSFKDWKILKDEANHLAECSSKSEQDLKEKTQNEDPVKSNQKIEFQDDPICDVPNHDDCKSVESTKDPNHCSDQKHEKDFGEGTITINWKTENQEKSTIDHIPDDFSGRNVHQNNCLQLPESDQDPKNSIDIEEGMEQTTSVDVKSDEESPKLCREMETQTDICVNEPGSQNTLDSTDWELDLNGTTNPKTPKEDSDGFKGSQIIDDFSEDGSSSVFSFRKRRSKSESNLKSKVLNFSVSTENLNSDVLTISFVGDCVNISSSSKLLAKSNIDISSTKQGTTLSLRPFRPEASHHKIDNSEPILTNVNVSDVQEPNGSDEPDRPMLFNSSTTLGASLSSVSTTSTGEIANELEPLKRREVGDSGYMSSDAKPRVLEDNYFFEESSSIDTVIDRLDKHELINEKYEPHLPENKLYNIDIDNAPSGEDGEATPTESDNVENEDEDHGIESKFPSMIQATTGSHENIVDEFIMDDHVQNEEDNQSLEEFIDAEFEAELECSGLRSISNETLNSAFIEEGSYGELGTSSGYRGMIEKSSAVQSRTTAKTKKLLRFSQQVDGKVEFQRSITTKLCKILFIGSSSTGKTSLIRRYVKNTFAPSYRATIGADFLAKVVHWDSNLSLRLQLWDIAGQDRFSLLSRSFYKDAEGAFIVSDLSRPETLEAVIRWKDELDTKVQRQDGQALPCFLIANKCDLLSDTSVQSKQHSKICQQYGFHGWMQTSAKEDINVNEAINMLLRQIAENEANVNHGEDEGPNQPLDEDSIVLEPEKKKKKGCSC